jgi:hypothetical protein
MYCKDFALCSPAYMDGATLVATMIATEARLTPSRP